MGGDLYRAGPARVGRGLPKARGRRWCRASGAAGAALIYEWAISATQRGACAPTTDARRMSGPLLRTLTAALRAVLGCSKTYVALVPIVDRWSAGKERTAWLFAAPGGGPLRESNWKRSVGWRAAREAAGVPDVRVHDLRHTAASLWLATSADPKVVQRVLGHATAAMTLDLYGHLIDANLWQAARLIGGTSGAPEAAGEPIRTEYEPGQGTKKP